MVIGTDYFRDYEIGEPDRMSEEVQPTHVYHYTTAHGLKGIIEDQEIWATDIFCLNDWTEFYHGISIFKAHLKERIPTSQTDDLDEQIGAKVLDALDMIGPETHPHTYVASFSEAEEGDDLSQWRAYCPKGGYTIAFPRARLSKLAEKNGFLLVQCAYGAEPSKRVAEKFWCAMRERYREYSAHTRVHPKTSNVILSVLSLVVSECKDSAFEAEREWRLVSMLSGKPSLRFRVRGSLLIPYVAFDLNDETLWKQARIVLSPSPRDSEGLRLESVKTLLKSELEKHNLPSTCIDNVRASKIPYRSAIGG